MKGQQGSSGPDSELGALREAGKLVQGLAGKAGREFFALAQEEFKLATDSELRLAKKLLEKLQEFEQMFGKEKAPERLFEWARHTVESRQKKTPQEGE